jgi:hypothetical protein
MTLAEGGKETVTLTLVAVAETAASPEASPAASPSGGVVEEGAPHGQSGLRIASYAAFGVGVIGLVGGTIFTLKSSSKRADADKLYAASCPCDSEDAAAKQVASLDDSARTAKTLGIVGFSLGGVGVAAGTVLFLMSNKHAEAPSATSTALEPRIGLGYAGVAGRF